MRERVKQTFGRRASSASQRARRRSRKGSRKTRSESLIVGSGQWDRLWSFFCLELLRCDEEGPTAEARFTVAGIRNGRIRPLPQQYEGKCPGACIRCPDMLWLALVDCVFVRGCSEYALCVWRAATELANRSKVIDAASLAKGLCFLALSLPGPGLPHGRTAAGTCRCMHHTLLLHVTPATHSASPAFPLCVSRLPTSHLSVQPDSRTAKI